MTGLAERDSPQPASDEASAAPDPSMRRRWVSHPVSLASLSALLLWMAFPPVDSGWLGWFALVPFFLLVLSGRSKRTLYFASWVGGMLFWTLSIQWVRLSDPSSWLAWLVMAFALSSWWPGFLFLTRWAVFRLRLPLMMAAPIIWVALEYIRAFVVSGFPWYYLAHTQHAFVPLIQISDVTGSLGVSLLVALVNAWLVDLLTLPLVRPTAKGSKLTPAQVVRLVSVVGCLGLTLVYGAFRLATAAFVPGPKVALLQSSIPQRLKMGADENKLLDIYRRLTDEATRDAEKPALIVWPETSYPFGYVQIDPAVDDAALSAQLEKITRSLSVNDWRARANTLSTHLHGWANQTGVPTLVGSITYDHRPGGHGKYNSALLFEPGKAAVQAYHKLHLVPFGEYVPLIETFPWLIGLTPYHGDYVPTLQPGPGPRWLDVGGIRYAVAICFEDTVPHVARRLFAEVTDGKAPDVLVNLSNDGWFGGSSEHEMHLVASLFRAIEHRVPLVRAANTGVSAVVDGNGRILEALDRRGDDGIIKEGVLSRIVPLDSRTSLYTAWGDWLGLSCLAVTIGLIPLAFFPRRIFRPQ